MRIIIATRSDVFSRRGGDTVQFLEYVKELRKLGVEAELTGDTRASLDRASLIHIGGIDRILESYWFWSRARRARKPIVLSPIFHPRDRVSHFNFSQRREPLQRLAHSFLPASAVEVARSFGYAAHDAQLWLPAALLAAKGPESARRRVLGGSLSWLVIAKKEGRTLRDTFKVEPLREYLVPNGVPDDFFAVGERVPSRRGVLIVGRLEARKNQLSVLQALKGTGVQITVVGAKNPFHAQYCEAVLDEIRSRPEVTYLPEVDHKDMQSIYRRHAVHVSASWFEVAPLVDLEAAACGCAVVATRAGYTSEYLGDAALYVDPSLGTTHLHDTILEALERSSALGHEALLRCEQYRWSSAAARLRDAYDEALSTQPRAQL